MKRMLVLSALSLLGGGVLSFAQPVQEILRSPDGSLEIRITASPVLRYELLADGEALLRPSAVGMELSDGERWGEGGRLLRTERRSVDTVLASPLYRRSSVRERYNACVLAFDGGWSVEFRAYDDGVAYRFRSERADSLDIRRETVEYVLPGDAPVAVPYVNRGKDGDFASQFLNSFENVYDRTRLSGMKKDRLAILPLVAEAPGGRKLCLTEADLQDYPGLFLLPAAAPHTLAGVHAPCPDRVVQGGHNRLQGIVETRLDRIARVAGTRTFPWRVTVVADRDPELAETDLVYLLAEPSRLADVSWVKPGKVAWEWWNDWNITGVDFPAGVNTETYRHYIDFAAEHGIEYVILDEGWAVNLQADLMQVVPEIDLPALVEYGRRKGVDLILWAGYYAFDRDMEEICRHYAAMGIKGFKIDFMDRNDQQMVAFNWKAVETCARYGLVVDLHGMYQPAGMNRTWPNVLNFEGVFGLEQMKWSSRETDQLTYDVTVPFIRQVAGPMDYTQGAMRNAAPGRYYPDYSAPMSQGTRCRQLALYLVLDSPLNMLCDSPDQYRREPECTEFIASVPTVWDETRILAGEMGEYIVTARRSGDRWYIGGLTGPKAREIELDLSFLPASVRQVTVFRDGVNAGRNGTDYRKETIRTGAGRRLKLQLAPGGGFVVYTGK